MFVAKNQIFVFFACVAFGACCGMLFSVSAAVKRIIKNKWVKILPDVLAFCAFSAFYVWFSYSLKFPSYRIYMTAGAILGLFLYMKSFHIMLAIFAEKLYNITVIKFLKHKSERKASKRENVGNNERRISGGRTAHKRRGKNHFGREV